MKIAELRFKNLNSLYGEWVIDFTDPEYLGNGIFALTGPTGSGKSTILDAVCLALYGATPRLGRITQGGNEVMSRRTGECYAEVVFASQAGRFRCHWEQRRARKKSDGALQPHEHQIAHAETGKPIETKKSLVPGIVEEKTGMDFSRFTRSILLAQGGFDTFLKAGVEQKSRILEQITGTEIYSEISRRVHVRQREEHENLKGLQAEISGIVILEPEQEKQIRQDLEEKQKQEGACAAQVTEAAHAVAWLTGIEKLKKEIRALSETSEKLHMEIEAFKPDRERLNRAVKAAELDGDYATLKAVRKQQATDQAALKREGHELLLLEGTLIQRSGALKSNEQQTCKAREDLKQAAPLIRKVRSLDQRLAEQGRAIASLEAGCKKDAAKIDADGQLRRREQEKHSKAAAALQQVTAYLDEHASDEWLVGGLTGIEEQLRHLVAKQKKIAEHADEEQEAKAALRRCRGQLEACMKKHKTRQQKLKNAENALEQARKDLSVLLGGRQLREYRMEKESLLREMALLARIAELEAHRAKLEDGKPCPLCGSRDHPFARGNVPVPDETEQRIEALSEQIQKAEDQEAVIKKCETAEKRSQKILSESETLQLTAANEKESAEKKLFDLTGRLADARADFENLKRGVCIKLQVLGIKDIADADVSCLRQSLQERLRKWQAQVEKKAEIEKKIVTLDSEMRRLDAVIETQGRTLAEKQEALDGLKKEHAATNAERSALFGDKKPDTEENRLNRAIAHAEAAEQEARAFYDEAQQKRDAAKTRISSLKEQIKKRTFELKHLEPDFDRRLQHVGFIDEKQFLQACLTASERNALALKAKDLDTRETDHGAREKDRQARLSMETAKRVTDKTLGELEPQLKALENQLDALRDGIAGLKHKLAENMAARERIKEKQTAVEAQKKEYHRWETLHYLIGSADGRKYRNFAQGLTFERMVSHANRQLEKMTDRYLLIRDDAKPLELNVVDNYQAGEIRSTRNLSGGESFIVSLTLALGLSRMAGRKVRVDSLFLDEGFGTLDEEALETALETLASLHQDGKLIGIISHVSALKERIGTQISIMPGSGGKSTLTGPGCSRIVSWELSWCSSCLWDLTNRITRKFSLTFLEAFSISDSAANHYNGLTSLNEKLSMAL